MFWWNYLAGKCEAVWTRNTNDDINGTEVMKALGRLYREKEPVQN